MEDIWRTNQPKLEVNGGHSPKITKMEDIGGHWRTMSSMEDMVATLVRLWIRVFFIYQ